MSRAWVWRIGTMTDIGTLGGPQAAAYAINNTGQIVGSAQTSTDADHGFVYQNGKFTDIGLNVFPYAINNNGVIVGAGGCGAAASATPCRAGSPPAPATRCRKPKGSTTRGRSSPTPSSKRIPGTLSTRCC
jgi:probable HAF family extracellular repeat protein